MEEPPKLKVVSPFSGNFERNKGLTLEYLPYADVFGVAEITEVLNANPSYCPEVSAQEPASSFLLSEVKNDPNLVILPGMNEVLAKLREQILEKAANPLLQSSVLEFVVTGINNNSELKNILKKEGETIKFYMKDIPDNLFLGMILAYVEHHIKKHSAFEVREKKLRRRFLLNLKKRIEDGTLKLNLATAVARVKRYKTRLRDPLTHSLGEIFGEVEIKTRTISISSNLTSEVEEEAYTHEMVHAIGGGEWLIWSDHSGIDSKSGLVWEKGEVIQHRSGFSIGNPSGDILKWLNEATTQSIALLILNKSDNDFYKKEIELMEELLTQGNISRQLLYSAYSMDTLKGAQDEFPKEFKDFLETIDRAYDTSNFLFRLDMYIKFFGVKKTIEHLKTVPDLIKKFAPRLPRSS